MAEAHLDALRSSVNRLRNLASPMSKADLTVAAYPTEWTIADVLSHLGSGAVITLRRLEDTLAGRDTPDDFAPGVWDSWNAKGPVDKRDDALSADADLMARLDRVTAEEQESFSSPMGPMALGFQEFVGMRLNEHGLHTWDIEVAGDPSATIPQPVAELIVDNLELIARFTAKPTGDPATFAITTTDPERGFTVELSPDSVSFAPADADGPSEVELPAEAFARLVYGRLDPDHTPPNAETPALDVLRQVFPGP